MAKNKEYISLKEASEISGYSPDYVGQLIRSGKLLGKQVFQNAVWTTTEEDLRAYMANKRASTPPKRESAIGRFLSKRQELFEVPRLATWTLYTAAVLSLCLFLGLFYILASSLELRLDEHATQILESKSTP